MVTEFDFSQVGQALPDGWVQKRRRTGKFLSDVILHGHVSRGSTPTSASRQAMPDLHHFADQAIHVVVGVVDVVDVAAFKCLSHALTPAIVPQVIVESGDDRVVRQVGQIQIASVGAIVRQLFQTVLHVVNVGFIARKLLVR